MRTARVAATLLLALLAACSNGPDLASKFSVPTPKTSTGAPRPLQTVAPGRLRPPSGARLFAGTASTPGQLIHYCKGSTCEESPPQRPAYLKVPSRAFVVFTLGSEPSAATAEIRSRPSDQPTTVKLNPGSLMYFSHDLTPGRFLVDLFVRWRGSEARWRFGVIVTE